MGQISNADIANSSFSELFSSRIGNNSNVILKDGGRVDKEGILSKIGTFFKTLGGPSEEIRTRNQDTLRQLEQTLSVKGMSQESIDELLQNIRQDADITSGSRSIKGSDITALRNIARTINSFAPAMQKVGQTLVDFSMKQGGGLSSSTGLLFGLLAAKTEAEIETISPKQKEVLAESLIGILIPDYHTKSDADKLGAVQVLLEGFENTDFKNLLQDISAGLVQSPEQIQRDEAGGHFESHIAVIKQNLEEKRAALSAGTGVMPPPLPAPAALNRQAHINQLLLTTNPIRETAVALGFKIPSKATIVEKFVEYNAQRAQSTTIDMYLRDNSSATRSIKGAVAGSLTPYASLFNTVSSNMFTNLQTSLLNHINTLNTQRAQADPPLEPIPMPPRFDFQTCSRLLKDANFSRFREEAQSQVIGEFIRIVNSNPAAKATLKEAFSSMYTAIEEKIDASTIANPAARKNELLSALIMGATTGITAIQPEGLRLFSQILMTSTTNPADPTDTRLRDFLFR